MTSLKTLCVALGAGLVLIGGASLPEATRAGGGDQCALRVERAHGETRLTAVLLAPRVGTTGTYHLTVTQPGGLSLDQSGDFTAAGGGDVELSDVTLSARPETLSAHLRVKVGGRTVSCPHITGPTSL